ncbi:MAG TPA: hypothetical protein VH331_09250 [Allosphingosinicella sp.]|jgi:hypothetical protein|nr:hypothetical protein [Allosphingosinicella sp.]
MDVSVNHGGRWPPRLPLTKIAAAAGMALSLLVASDPLQAATAFDLVCQTRARTQVHFRFDLQQKKWCVGDCHSVWFIDGLSDTMIRLTTTSTDRNNNWTIEINRYTSTFSAVHRGYGDEPADGGHCQPSAFSGFPERKF